MPPLSRLLTTRSRPSRPEDPHPRRFQEHPHRTRSHCQPDPGSTTKQGVRQPTDSRRTYEGEVLDDTHKREILHSSQAMATAISGIYTALRRLGQVGKSCYTIRHDLTIGRRWMGYHIAIEAITSNAYILAWSCSVLTKYEHEDGMIPFSLHKHPYCPLPSRIQPSYKYRTNLAPLLAPNPLARNPLHTLHLDPLSSIPIPRKSPSNIQRSTRPALCTQLP